MVPIESGPFVKCFQEAFYKTHTFSRDQWEDTNVNVGVQVSKVLNIINNITGFVSSSWTDWAVTLSLSRRDVNSSQMFLYGPTVLLWLAFHPELNKEFTKNSLLNHKTQFFVLYKCEQRSKFKKCHSWKGQLPSHVLLVRGRRFTVSKCLFHIKTATRGGCVVSFPTPPT